MIYYLEETALGLLGWDEEKTLHSDINAIWIGEKGRWKELEICFGLHKKSQNENFEKLSVQQQRRQIT